MTAPAASRTNCVRKLLFFVAVWAAVTAPTASGQGVPAPNAAASQSSPKSLPAPVFEVAAIHQNTTDQSGRSHIVSSSHDGRFTAINVTLKALLQWAFAIADARILGGPAWFNSARFNIEAKADSSVDEQLRGLDSDVGRLRKQQMLQALLADRFGLKVHQETRKLPIYALTVAKSGPKFQPSQVNGTTVNARNGELTVRGSDNTIALLADALGKQLGRVVVDKTGLEGRYDLTLKWTPDELSDSQGGASGARSSTSDASAPSLFTAIQEQLGLKLVPEKGPVAVLVIDHVEMPSEN
jgi:uncharacterized protein (TIGR03435 family)